MADIYVIIDTDGENYHLVKGLRSFEEAKELVTLLRETISRYFFLRNHVEARLPPRPRYPRPSSNNAELDEWREWQRIRNEQMLPIEAALKACLHPHDPNGSQHSSYEIRDVELI